MPQEQGIAIMVDPNEGKSVSLMEEQTGIKLPGEPLEPPVNITGIKPNPEPDSHLAEGSAVDQIIANMKMNGTVDGIEAMVQEAVKSISNKFHEVAHEGEDAVQAFAMHLHDKASEIAATVKEKVSTGQGAKEDAEGVSRTEAKPMKALAPGETDGPSKEVPGVGTVIPANHVAGELVEKTGMDVAVANDKTVPGSNL